MSDLRCPYCGDRYSPPARFCIRDGYALVSWQPGDTPPGQRSVWDPRTAFRDPASQLSGRTLGERYELRETIGEGGMAFVYRATDHHSGATVAVKVLATRFASDADAIARLEREARLAQELSHPNTCKVIEFCHERGLRFLVMPLLIGETLEARLQRDGPLNPRSAVDVLSQLCSGLQHAHDLGILHRDIKPENVMLVPTQDDSGELAVLMDFGLARPTESPESDPDKLTDTGVVLGTPEFMSPEQVRGLPIDARSDQYAMGVLGFEILTGILPFPGGSTQQTMLHRLTDQPRSLLSVRPDAPAALDRILARAMAREPADRFSDMTAMGKALAASLT